MTDLEIHTRAANGESSPEVICRLFGEIINQYSPEATPGLLELGWVLPKHVIFLRQWPTDFAPFKRLRRVNAEYQGDEAALATASQLEILSVNRIKDFASIQKLAQLETLRIREGITPILGPIAHLTALQYLELYVLDTDISPLAGLSELRSLRLRGTMPSIDALASLSRLESLSLPEFAGDWQPLEKCVSLRKLDLGRTRTHSFAPLKFRLNNLIHLEELDISESAADISELSELTSLRILRLGTVIGDLSPLARFTKLVELGLRMYVQGEVAPLAHLCDLQILRLASFGGSIAPLARLTKLRELDLSGYRWRFGTSLQPLERLQALEALCLNSWTGSISSLAPLVHVKSLNLAAYDGPLDSLSRMRNIARLNLSSHTGPLDSIRPLVALETLYLDQHPQTDLDFTRDLPRLRTLCSRVGCMSRSAPAGGWASPGSIDRPTT